MKTVFIVDDSDSNLLLAEEALSGEYRVFTLQSAEVMFGLLENVTPDLILLDIEMPGTNGFDALRQLKSNEATSDLPVIFVTGRDDVSAEIHGFEMGIADFIRKPFSKPLLRARIKAYFDIVASVRRQEAEKFREAGFTCQ